MGDECQTLINMLMSTDEESRFLAEILVEQFIINKNDDQKLECLRNFLERDIYSDKYNPFDIPEECEFVKDRIKNYFASK